MTFGITDAGFTPMRLDDCKTEFETAFKEIFGDINVEAPSVFSQIIGVCAKIGADWWEGLEAVYMSLYPTSATGVPLSNLVTLSNISRLAEIFSTVSCELTGTGGTVIPAGSSVSNNNGDIFNLVTEVTLPASGNFIANVAGAVVVTAGTIVNIVTPISGWDSVYNDNSGVMGRATETDAELRVRRERSRAIIGAGVLGAIESRVLNDVPNVTVCRAFENSTSVTDPVTSRPPKSIEVVVAGGIPQDILDLLWSTKPGGIEYYGNQSGSVTDSRGNIHVVKYSIPTIKYLHVKVTILTYLPEEIYPVDGSEQITIAILEKASMLALGSDVITQRWLSAIYSVDGMASVKVEQALTTTPGGSPAFVETNLVVASTEQVELANNRITVIE